MIKSNYYIIIFVNIYDNLNGVFILTNLLSLLYIEHIENIFFRFTFELYSYIKDIRKDNRIFLYLEWLLFNAERD